MKIKLKLEHLLGVRAGSIGEALGFDVEESGVVYFKCIFYGLPGTFILTQWEIESLDA